MPAGNGQERIRKENIVDEKTRFAVSVQGMAGVFFLCRSKKKKFPAAMAVAGVIHISGLWGRKYFMGTMCLGNFGRFWIRVKLQEKGLLFSGMIW